MVNDRIWHLSVLYQDMTVLLLLEAMVTIAGKKVLRRGLEPTPIKRSSQASEWEATLSSSTRPSDLLEY